jgi:hypothetical protein
MAGRPQDEWNIGRCRVISAPGQPPGAASGTFTEAFTNGR